METAKRSVQGARSTDRVLEALSTLAAFLDRTINEVKALDSEFQSRILQAVRDTETSLQSAAAERLEMAVSETRTKLEDQFKQRIAELSNQWESERDRLDKEVRRTVENAAQWEAERARLNTEIDRLNRANAEAQEEMQKARRIANEAEKKAAESIPPPPPPADIAGITGEIENIEKKVRQISDLIDDPATDLSTVIRKNVERSELQAYLKGIRFAAEKVHPDLG